MDQGDERGASQPYDAPRRTMPRPHYFYLNMGTIITQTFGTWWRNLFPFILMAALIYLPLILIGGWFVSQVPMDKLERGIFDACIGLVGLPLSCILAAAVTFAVIEHIGGRKPGVGACLAKGLSQILPVLGVTLLFTLIFLGGLILLIVPGIIFLVMYYVAIPVCVIERPGIGASLSRSAALTKGHRWTVFGSFFVIALIAGFAVFIVMIPFIPMAMKDPKVMESTTWFFANQGLGLLFQPLSATVPAVIYYQLRAGKENVQAADMARAFE